MNAQQTIQIALQHHQSGRLREAEALYRQILAAEPQHAGALHFLGVIACQVGRHDVAVDLIRRALAIRPGYAEAHYSLGNALKDKGQLDEAIEAWRQAVANRADHPEAHSNLCIALKDKGRLEEAVEAGRRALAIRPDYAEAHYNLGNALMEKGDLDEAIAAFRQTIALTPGFSGAHNNLGVALKDKGQLDEAIAAYRQALVLTPGFADAHNNLGVAFKDNGQLDEAIAAFRQAIALNPDFADAHFNLGNALRDKGLLDEAIAAYPKAIALTPDFADAHNNLGIVLKDSGRMDEAIATYRQAIGLTPDLADAHFNLALLLLQLGDFRPGWEEYEWRWKTKPFLPARRDFPQPQWDGSPLDGRTILLHAEQGFGDALQFIRFAPLVKQRGGRVIVECQESLRRVLPSMGQDLQVVAKGQPLPAFDVHCPLLSLPHRFATEMTTIPKDIPYLHADADAIETWQQRWAPYSHALKVGIVWAGSPTHKNDRNRSVKLATLTPLAEVRGVRFISIQKGEAATEAKSPPQGMELLDAGQELKDFADTAALVATLDLVIAVDTSVAHLAGALGKPVWVLLPFSADWRWLFDRSDSPWYPTMRLFRQRRAGEWDPVVAEVREQLQALVKSRG